jgi:hypothetical protein
VRDIWDAEYEKLDRVIAVTSGIGAILSLSAAYAGLGWWSVAVFVAVSLAGAFLVHRTEQEFKRIRAEMGVGAAEETSGLGWNTKKEARIHFANMPASWRETHRVIRYFDKEGHQRWGVKDKPRYWRRRRAQEKPPPEPDVKAMANDMHRKLIGRAE